MFNLDLGNLLVHLKLAEGSTEKVFNDVAKALKETTNRIESISASGRKSFGVIKTSVGIALAPLKLLTEGFMLLEVSIIASAIASVKAASDYEVLNQKIKAMMSNQELANKAFQESIELQGKSMFPLEQIVQARINLETAGVSGAKAMEQIANAAAITGQSIEGLAYTVIRMMPRGLRALGIQLQQEGNMFMIQFRDKMGQARTVVANSFREAQQALLNIFGEKFEGGLVRMAATLPGLLNILRNTIREVRVAFGIGFLQESKVLVNDVIEAVAKMKPWAKEAGIAFGKEMLKVHAALMASFEVFKRIVEQIKTAFERGQGGTVILAAFTEGAALVGSAIIAAFKVSLKLWELIGTILGDALMEVLYKSGIPGMEYIGKKHRAGQFERTLGGLSDEQLKAMASQYNIPTTTSKIELWGFGEGSIVKTIDKERKKIIADLASMLAEQPEGFQEQVLKYYSKVFQTPLELNKGYNITKSLADVGDTVKNELKSLGLEAVQRVQKIANEVAKAAGEEPIDIVKMWSDAFDKQLELGKEKIEKWREVLNEETKKASAITPPTPWGLSADEQKFILRDLKDQLALIGMTNKEREKTIAILAFQRKMEDLYKDDLYKQAKAVKLFAREYEKMQKVQEGAMVGQKIKQWGEDALDVMSRLGEASVRAFDSMSQALTDMVMTGKADWKSLARGIMADLVQIIIRMQMARLINNAIIPWFAYTTTAVATVPAADGAAQGGGLALLAHKGGYIEDITSKRFVAASMFKNAPRLHTGLLYDEYPAILQRGEKVIPRGGEDTTRREKDERPVIIIKAWDVSDITRNSKVIENIFIDSIRRRSSVRSAIKTYS